MGTGAGLVLALWAMTWPGPSLQSNTTESIEAGASEDYMYQQFLSPNGLIPGCPNIALLGAIVGVLAILGIVVGVIQYKKRQNQVRQLGGKAKLDLKGIRNEVDSHEKQRKKLISYLEMLVGQDKAKKTPVKTIQKDNEPQFME